MTDDHRQALMLCTCGARTLGPHDKLVKHAEVHKQHAAAGTEHTTMVKAVTILKPCECCGFEAAPAAYCRQCVPPPKLIPGTTRLLRCACGKRIHRSHDRSERYLRRTGPRV